MIKCIRIVYLLDFLFTTEDYYMNSELNEKNTAAAEVEVVDNRDFELRISDEERARKKKIQEIWDKITTGILIFLMASPVLILAYIFIWFLTK